MRLLILFLFVLPLTCFSQKPPVKVGDIPMEDMKMTVYSKDTSAAAVILADYGDSKISYNQTTGFSLTFERITRIKILKKEGYEWANFEIPLYIGSQGKDEYYTKLKGYTYNLEGGKIVETKMKNDAVFKEQTNENWKRVKFTLPNVKVGSIVEVSYEVSSPFWVNFHDWEFQSTIPTRLSEYRAKVPEYFTYQKYMQGYISLNVNETNNVLRSFTITSSERSEGRATQTTFSSDKIDYMEAQSRWAAYDVPAFKEEPYMSTYRDFISKINFELASVQMPGRPVDPVMGTWESINKNLLEDEQFGIVVSRSNFLNKKVEELTAGVTDPAQKIAAIYSYVKENVGWDGTYRKYTDGNFRRVLDEKKGSSSEINLLLTSMLQKADLVADPVLISTRDNGMVREHVPVSTQFNYVIASVKVGDKTILLDATDRSLPMNVLPERCLNGTGFVISKTNNRWISLAPNFKSRSGTSIDLTMDAEGVLAGKITLTYDGYEAQEERAEYNDLGEKEYLKTLAETESWEIKNSQIENISKISEPVKEIHEVSLENYAQNIGGVIYINPILRSRWETNPFKLEKREYPVDFKSPFEEMLTGKIVVPEGFIVEELPKPKVLMLPNNAGRYTHSVSLNGNTIAITSLLSINKSMFTQDEYEGLREFFNQVVAKQAEQIVLKKK